MRTLLAGALLAGLAACQPAAINGEVAREQAAAELAQPLIEARLAGQPVPLLDTPERALDLETAYAIQRRAVLAELDGRQPAGFKAGLTTAASRQAFGVEAPVAGVLWPDSALPAAGDGVFELSVEGLSLPMIELELGFELARAIMAPLPDVDSLRRHLAGVRAVLELPHLDFDSSGAPTGLDLIASNVAGWHYVAGALHPLDGVPDLNALRVRLHHEGERIIQARAGEVMDDQWQALLWLVNRVLASGWTLEPGQLLITGAIGPMLPLRPGEYAADFGALGELRLRVE